MIEKIAANDFCWKVFNRLAWLPANRVRDARIRSLHARLLSRFPLPALFNDCSLKSPDGILLPKLLGTYESELHSTFRKWENTGFNRIVDIGAAEGYLRDEPRDDKLASFSKHFPRGENFASKWQG